MMREVGTKAIRWGMPTLIECAGPEENFRLCRELGLRFVELNMNLPVYQAADLADLGPLAQRYGVDMTVHMDENFNAADFNPLIRDAWLRTLEQTAEAAKALDVRLLNLHLSKGVYFTLPDRRVYLFEKYADQYLRNILDMRQFCERILDGTDIQVCIENTDGFSDYQKRAVDILLESERFGLTWDIGHSHTAHADDEPFLRMHSDRIRHFHIHDAMGKDCHLELGTGQIDLDERLSYARNSGAACVLETKTVRSLVNSVSWLRKFGWIA